MKRSRIALFCMLILIFVNVFTACTPPTPKSEDKERKTFSQMTTDEIEEAAEAAYIAHVRKECSKQYGKDPYFDGYDIDDLGYRITDISIERAEKKVSIKGYMSFSNDYDEKRVTNLTVKWFLKKMEVVVFHTADLILFTKDIKGELL